VLAEFEALSEQGHIDLLYGDESRVSLLPCVPYGWQFTDEQVVMPSDGHGGVNCFALLSRQNECHAHFTQGKVTAAWISERLDALSLSLPRPTVVVLDNASVHVKAVKDRGFVWQERGLFVWFLPTYSPHLTPIKPQHRRDSVAQVKVRVAAARRLRRRRHAAFGGLDNPQSRRQHTQDQLFAVQERHRKQSNLI